MERLSRNAGSGLSLRLAARPRDTVGPCRWPGAPVGGYRGALVALLLALLSLADAQAVARSRPRGHCGRAQTLSLGRPRPQYVNTATTLSDDGTATVLAGGEEETLPHGSLVPVEIGPHGLWGSVSRRGRPFRRTPEISATGDGPVAASAGRGGKIALFNVGSPPVDTIAHSTLTGTGARFGRATDLPDHETINSPLLAANLAGAFVSAWSDNDRVANAPDSLHATIGTPGGALAPPRTIASAAEQPQDAVVGIDGHGNAILLWDSWRARWTHGMFAACHRE